ncbi:hypothetical protein COZ78_00695 [bacterium (Candidatus Gribaldobacteria) CG_4_8_14_3_um_filter_42_11]|uniref:Uncharacterized protein n=1 Tax=bacterium (Candidatus Gribaldobacteria) CG_4_8_14_3_um_filter_42_11 TaxID=2014267 RepID=A0A2M7IYW2_9BACT|nr:MAG: hypothetical protein COZ78_00695 [bacterium (Candidatus Gribaldobacteria) CG_4_8_14_3_um_filter_42_11]
MRLSKLQKYILEKCYNEKCSLPADFYGFYGKNAKSKKLIQDIIHKSLDSLVVGDLLTALGKKTAKKWFIHKVKLTNLGKKIAIKIIKNRQRKLPIK